MVQIPTLTQLYNQQISSLESELNITIPLFGRSYLRAKAMVQAGRLWLLYLNLAKLQKNIFIDTADPVASGGTLERFGLVKLGRLPFPARQGQYSVLVTGTIGAIIPAQTTWKSNDDSLNPGKQFVLDADFVLDGINLITIRALEAGDESRLSVGNGLTANAPIALVDSIVIVQSQVIEPQASENIEDYRQKGIDAYRLEPQGGAPADYRLWSSEVQGVVQTYPYAAAGNQNAVNLFVEADNPNGVPTQPDLDAVRDNIELPTADRPARKPITVTVNYLPITPVILQITIDNFIGIDPDIQTLLFNAIESELADVRPVVGAIDIVADRNDYFDINTIISIILSVRPGSVFGAVTLTAAGNPVTSITFTNGDIPILNSVSYV